MTNPTPTPLSIIDLGCGTGLNTVKWQQKFPNSSIHGIDISLPMIRYAQKHHNHTSISYHHADLSYWASQPQNPTDLIVSNASLQWINPLEPLVKTLSKTITPNGQLSLSLFGPKTYCELQNVLSSFFPNSPPITATRFFAEDSLHALFSTYFQQVSIQVSLLESSYTSLLNLLQTIKFTGTTGPGLSYPGLWTKHRLKNLESLYLERFNTILSTHHIIYIQAGVPK